MCQSLAERADAVLWDVDGVLIDGDVPIIPGRSAWNAITDTVPMAVVTNNASRTPPQVSEVLTGHGIRVQPDQVMTSAVAAAALVAERHPGAQVLAIGGDGVVTALTEQGLAVTPAADATPESHFDVVVQGLGRAVSWEHLAAGTRALHRGAHWVLTNADTTLPTSDGPLPGNGALARVIAAASTVEPQVTGKPEPQIFRAALDLLPTTTPDPIVLMVGDRLDTDIAGAHATGIESLWVATGVHDLTDVLDAPSHHRPTYLADDAMALLRPHAVPHIEENEDGVVATCCTVRLALGHKTARVIHSGEDPNHRVTAYAALHWHAKDAGLDLTALKALREWATRDWAPGSS